MKRKNIAWMKSTKYFSRANPKLRTRVNIQKTKNKWQRDEQL